MNDQENYSVLEFRPFPKMARLNREVIVTEKIDGTNAQIYILPTQGMGLDHHKYVTSWNGEWAMAVGSRNRWIMPENDNFGFARWCKENFGELLKLGPGRHFGEWWGGGIQRGYGLKEKRFSLFNTQRWIPDPEVRSVEEWGKIIDRPGVAERVDDVSCRPGPRCCFVVPMLYRGEFCTVGIKNLLFQMKSVGSSAAPGFLPPEGIVVYHTAAGQCFKVTLEHDEKPKGLEEPISSAQLTAGKEAADEVFRQKCKQ